MPSQRDLDPLAGQRCVDVIAQRETGGDLLLHFGRMIPYAGSGGMKVRTTHRGEYTLMIQCPWRLNSAVDTLVDWTTIAGDEVEAKQAPLLLRGQTVIEAQLSSIGPDVTVRFANGLTLTVFCALNPSLGDCWFLLLPDGSSLVAASGGRLVMEGADR